MKPIVTAITSYGMSGEVFHAPFIEDHNGFQLKYILERSKDRSKERYPNATIVRTYEEILNDPLVELVVVNTPNLLHYSMTKAALLSGKHVIVEKPFTVTVAEGEELIQLAKAKGLLISVYHNRRLEGEFKTIQKLIKGNTLGDIETFEIHYDRYRPEIGPKKWKEEVNPGAGVLYDLGPHIIDQALQLFGKPLSFQSDLQIQRVSGTVVDYFHITLNYPSHTAVATASMITQGVTLKYLIRGSKGVYRKYGTDPQEELLKNGHSPLEPGWGFEPQEQWGVIELKDGTSYKLPTLHGTYMEFYEAIYQTIRNGAKPLITPEESLESVRIIETAESKMKFHS